MVTMQLENCVYCGGDAHDTSGIYTMNGKAYKCAWCNGTGKVPIDTQWDKNYMESLRVRKIEVIKFRWGKWLFSRFCDCLIVGGLIVLGVTVLVGLFAMACIALKIPISF